MSTLGRTLILAILCSIDPGAALALEPVVSAIHLCAEGRPPSDLAPPSTSLARALRDVQEATGTHTALAVSSSLVDYCFTPDGIFLAPSWVVDSENQLTHVRSVAILAWLAGLHRYHFRPPVGPQSRPDIDAAELAGPSLPT
jgi:hypothetical protein